MSAFAVVERELRTAARSRLTPWQRIIAAGVALLFAWSILSISDAGPGTANSGKFLFETLSWFAFALCLIEGVRRTYDSVSAERREGLLELLLLTPLKGYQLILGKMAAVSVGSAFAFLAALPAMAIAFPAGGVTIGEFWRTQLALANTLFVSMCCGIFVSARSCDGQRSLAGAIALLAMIVLVPFGVDALIVGHYLFPFSPGMGMALADDAIYQTHPDDFWRAMIEAQALGWTLVALAGARARRLKPGDQAGPPPMPAPEENLAWNYTPAPSLRAKPKAPLMEINPVAWILRRSAPSVLLVWMAIGFLVISQLGIVAFWVGFRGSGGLYTALFLVQMLLPVFLIAVAVSRSLTEARRNGTMEALISTALSDRAIGQGFWNEAWKRIRLPFVLFALFVAVMIVVGSIGLHSGSMRWANLSWNVVRHATVVLQILAATSLVLWLAARTVRPAYAVGLSVIWVVAVPWAFTQLYWVVIRSFFSGMPLTWGLWSWRIASLIIDAYLLWLFLKSRRLLLNRFGKRFPRALWGGRDFFGGNRGRRMSSPERSAALKPHRRHTATRIRTRYECSERMRAPRT